MISLPTELPRTITRGFTISTKFLGPTNTRGSRVKATYKRDSERIWNATTHWNHAIDAEQNHFRAAQELLNDLNEDRRLYFESIGAADEAGRFEIVAQGWDADRYYFLAAQP